MLTPRPGPGSHEDVPSDIGKKEGCHGFQKALSIPGTVTGRGSEPNPDSGPYPDPSHVRDLDLDADPDTASTPYSDLILIPI